MNFIKRVVLLLIPFITVSLYAQDVPRVISYQGVLVGADGKPVNQTGATVRISFYDAESGGNALSSTSYPVNIVGGLFSTIVTIPPASAMDLNQELWLEVEYSNIQYKRVQLAASLYALNIPDNVVTERKIASNAVTSAKIKDREVKAIDIGDNEVVKSIKGLKEAIDIVAGNPNIRIKVDGQNIVIEGKDTVKAAEQLIGGIPSGVPVGTILPYMGDGSDLTTLETEGWYLCDGRLIANLSGLSAVQKTDLQQLFSRAGNPNSGNLPDLRGYFMRGADRGQGRDLDFGDRSGNGEKIGSVQGDEFKTHRHHMSAANRFSEYNQYHEFPQFGYNSGDPAAGYQTAPSGGSETRPKNVYVNYIIKAR